MEPIIGIDLSRHNWRNGVPWSALGPLHRAGVRYLIARASIGTLPDGSFEHNRHRALVRSWVPGAYHFLADGTTGTEQAEVFVRRIRETGGAEGLLTILDVEQANRAGSENHPTLRQVREFAAEFSKAYPRHQLGVYSNRSTWAGFGNPDITALGYDYAWHALYGVAYSPSALPERPPVGFGGEGRIPLWQWGALKVKLGDRVARLDGNAWYGSLAELRLLSVAERPPLPQRPAYIEAYNATIAAAGAAIKSIRPLAGSPAIEAGSKAALAAAIEAVDELAISGGKDGT